MTRGTQREVAKKVEGSKRVPRGGREARQNSLHGAELGPT